METIRLSSYFGVQDESEVQLFSLLYNCLHCYVTIKIEVVGLDLIDVKGKELLIVEAIVENGVSLSKLIDELKVSAIFYTAYNGEISTIGQRS